MTEMTPAGGVQAEVHPQQQWMEYTKSLISHLQSSGRYSGPQVQLSLRPMFAADEARMLRAPYRLLEFTGIGDGTVPGAMIGAAGAMASGNLALMTGNMVGNMIASSRAKKAAIPQWHDVGSGELIVTQYGFYALDAAAPVAPIRWDFFLSAQLTAWDSLEGDTEEGKVAIVTPAASTIFGLWSLLLYPQHPQLQALLRG